VENPMCKHSVSGILTDNFVSNLTRSALRCVFNFKHLPQRAGPMQYFVCSVDNADVLRTGRMKFV